MPTPGGPPQSRSPQQQGTPPGQAQGQDPAAQAINLIEQGFTQLGKMMAAAQGQLDPSVQKLFQSAVQATDAFIQDLSGPAQPQSEPMPRGPGGPMPPNANAGARPAPNMG